MQQKEENKTDDERCGRDYFTEVMLRGLRKNPVPIGRSHTLILNLKFLRFIIKLMSSASRSH